MSHAYANSAHFIGQMVHDAKISYVGANNRIPRATFYIALERKKSVAPKQHATETLIIPCEIQGAQAEGFVRSVGAWSWIYVIGWIRSYAVTGKYPQLRLIVKNWDVYDREMPRRGRERRPRPPEIPEVLRAPEDGDET